MSFSVLEHPFPVLERPFLLCPVLSHVPSRILAVPAWPVPDFGCPGPSRPLARFLACPVVPLSRDNDETSVPLSRKVALSRPVGNASLNRVNDLPKSVCATPHPVQPLPPPLHNEIAKMHFQKRFNPIAMPKGSYVLLPFR